MMFLRRTIRSSSRLDAILSSFSNYSLPFSSTFYFTHPSFTSSPPSPPPPTDILPPPNSTDSPLTLVALRARASAFGLLPSNSSSTPVTCYKQVSPLFSLPFPLLLHSFFFLPSPSSFKLPPSPVPSPIAPSSSAQFSLRLALSMILRSNVTKKI